MTAPFDDSMKRLVWEPWSGPGAKPAEVTTGALDLVEQEFGFRLPDEYRREVIDHGGATPSPGVVIAERGGRPFAEIFGTLFFVDSDADSEWRYCPENLQYMIDEMRSGSLAEWMLFDDRKDRLLPFAGDSGAGYFCFDFSIDVKAPPVLFMDYAARSPEDDGWDDSLYVIADSFTELLGMLGEP
jgi:SMI1 / KNR4 family (SUKH-1)